MRERDMYFQRKDLLNLSRQFLSKDRFGMFNNCSILRRNLRTIVETGPVALKEFETPKGSIQKSVAVVLVKPVALVPRKS